MTLKKHGPKLAAILLLVAVLLSACNQSVSTAPAATATLITPTGLFVTPLSAESGMDLIAEFAKGTAAAQTTIANGGTPTTPQPVATTSTAVTPQTGVTVAPTTPTNIVAVVTTPVVVVPSGPSATAGPKPASYTLQAGEFPYCIARRFNLNPDELLSLNGISDGGLYMPGLTLKIPQSGSSFPGSRALHTHPSTFTVDAATNTVYGVACYYGDVDPAAIASANGIAVSAKLTVGQKLNIP